MRKFKGSCNRAQLWVFVYVSHSCYLLACWNCCILLHAGMHERTMPGFLQFGTSVFPALCTEHPLVHCSGTLQWKILEMWSWRSLTCLKGRNIYWTVKSRCFSRSPSIGWPCLWHQLNYAVQEKMFSAMGLCGSNVTYCPTCLMGLACVVCIKFVAKLKAKRMLSIMQKVLL